MKNGMPEPLLAKKDRQKWHVWRGGSCPVSASSMVEVQRRYNSSLHARAGDLRWSHDLYYAFGADDIVAYRLLNSSPSRTAFDV